MLVLEPSNYRILTIYQVDDAITTLSRNLNSAFQFELYRTKNDEVIDRFSAIEDADKFIDEQDFDRNRVTVRARADNADSQRELNRLTNFRAEAIRDCPGFETGGELYRSDVLDADFCRDQAMNSFPTTVNFAAYPFSQIDWNEAASELKRLCERRSSYMYLNGHIYYGLENIG